MIRRFLLCISLAVVALSAYCTEPSWGLVRISVACLRGEPRHSAELVSQAIMGTPLRLLEKDGQWWKVESPDGYVSYIIGNSIVTRSDYDMSRWRSEPRLIVTAREEIRAYDSIGQPVTDLVNACIVEGEISGVNPVAVRFPDGREAYVDTAMVAPFDSWAKQDFDPMKLISIGESMMGTPYLWGGMSSKSLDCSGFVRVCYMDNGRILRRDASQQACTGMRIEPERWRTCRRGDLLFFGNAATGRVTHVAVYDHDGEYLHSSGRVRRNSIDPQSPIYLSTPFLHAVRIDGHEGSDGIMKVENHPWYFNCNE